MNSASFQEPVDKEVDHDQYRAVSKSAVACIVFAVLGLSAFLSPTFTIFPALGVLFGVVALVNFKRFGRELVGKPAAMIGLALSAIVLIGSLAAHIHEYNTEVPEGYERMSFADLKPGKRTGTEYSEKAIALHNQSVFLKGYTRPGVQRTGMKKFILVGDFGDCCFGGDPAITDVVAVEIIGDETVDYSWRKRKVIGTFRLNPRAVRIDEKDIPEVFYQIEAETVK